MTLLDVLDSHVASRGAAKALSFLGDGENETAVLTYAGLRAKALAIAAQLDGQHRALLLFPPGLEFVEAFFGCLYACVVAVPTYPPDPVRLERSLKRLRGIVADSKPTCVLTNSFLLAYKESLCAAEPTLAALPWLNVDDAVEHADRTREVSADSIALLQYTSGSTSDPRGVMVSHQNILHNCEYTYFVEGNEREGTAAVTWLPSYHDMGLIEGLLQPLYGGFTGHLIPTHAFIEKPMRWLQAMSKLRATNTGGPNFAYELCARRATEGDLAKLKLDHWRVAYNGAEPIRAATYDRFVEVFGRCGFTRQAFYPVYGLAEATLMVTSKIPSELPITLDVDSDALAEGTAIPPRDRARAKTLVSAGKARGGMHARIVENGEALEDGRVGEIWLSGPSVTNGYYGRDNAALFQAKLAGSDANWFCTGDLGFLRAGDLFVTGRIKDLIIVSGRNVYPQDIEIAVENAHPGVRRGAVAAFGYEYGDTEAVGVCCEVDEAKAPDLRQVCEALRSEVAKALDVSLNGVVLLARGELPKTSSGKLQRYAARKIFLDPSATALLREERDGPSERARGQASSEITGPPIDPPTMTAIEAFGLLAADNQTVALRYMEWTLRYATLNKHAEQVASALEALGVSPGDVVGVHTEPCLEYVIAMLACFKLGAIYFPLDPEFPAAFTRQLLADAKPKIVLRHTQATNNFPDEHPSVLLRPLVAQAAGSAVPPPRAPPSFEHPAYLSYAFTDAAGPTPLLATHAQLTAAANVMKTDARSGDTWLTRSHISTTHAVSEVLSALTSGVELYIASGPDMKCPAYLVQHMIDHQVTRFSSTGFQLRTLFATVIYPGKRLPKVREYLIYDDAPPPSLREKFAEMMHEASGVFLGGEGGAYAWRAGAKATDFEAVPGVSVQVAAQAMYGKIHIAGSPTHRTGRINDRGRLELFGYDDARERVHGVELNPEWVTRALREHPQVRDAFTRVSRDRLGEPRLLVYVVTDIAVQTHVLRQHIKERLPECFAPQSLEIVPLIPRDSHGNVDESALPQPPWSDPKERVYSPPRTPTEIALAELFGRVLQVRRVGRDDDFFELGGDSLLAMHVAFYAQEQQLPLTTRLLSEMKTLAKTAAALDALSPR